MSDFCDHKFVDSARCLKCHRTAYECRAHDGSPRVRELTTAERARMREALTKLRAPWVEGEPIDAAKWEAVRLAQLQAEYPDVADLIGIAK